MPASASPSEPSRWWRKLPPRASTTAISLPCSTHRAIGARSLWRSSFLLPRPALAPPHPGEGKSARFFSGPGGGDSPSAHVALQHMLHRWSPHPGSPEGDPTLPLQGRVEAARGGSPPRRLMDHLPLEGGGRPALAGRVGVTASQHMRRFSICCAAVSPTPDRLKAIRPSPCRGG